MGDGGSERVHVAQLLPHPLSRRERAGVVKTVTPVIHRRAPARPGAYVERPVPGLLRLPLSLLAAVGLPTSPILRRLRRARYCGEVHYDYRPLRPELPANPLTQTVFDLGLWDENGYPSASGFRGWSGSRHKFVIVEACRATRCYRAGPINAGVCMRNWGWRRSRLLGRNGPSASGPGGCRARNPARSTQSTPSTSPAPRGVGTTATSTCTPGTRIPGGRPGSGSWSTPCRRSSTSSP